jgi:putative lipoprotein
MAAVDIGGTITGGMQRLAAAVLVASIVAAPSGRAGAGESGPDPWFARDKALHFGATFVLSTGAYGVTAAITDRGPPRPILCASVGAGVAMTAGVAKEVLDLAGPGDASWRDLTWDVVGTATGLAVAWLLHRYVFKK